MRHGRRTLHPVGRAAGWMTYSWPPAAGALRIGLESALPGKIKGYTKQQYLVTLAQQLVVLPVCAAGWALGLLDNAKIYIYLLTGACARA